MNERTRRGVLGAVSAGVFGAVAGCTGGGGQSTYVTEEPDRTLRPTGGTMVASGDVPEFRYDLRNSGVTEYPGPTENFRRAWSYETRGKLTVTPAVVGETAYVGDRNGVFHAVDLESGEAVWTAEVEPGNRKGVDGSPTVADGRIVVGSGSDREDDDASVTALRADDGEVLWRHGVGKFARSAPAVVDGAVYAGGNDEVSRLDLASGEVDWTFETGAVEGADAPDAVFGGVAVVDDTVVAATRSGLVHGLDAATGEPRWSTTTGGNVHTTPAVADGSVYVGSYDGRVYAVSLADGEIRWRFDTGDLVVTSAAATASTVYAASKTGRVHALAAGDGSERWSASATDGEGAVTGGPVVAGDTVLVGTGRRESVVAFGADDGTRRWEFYARGAVRTPVTAVGEAMLVPTLGDELHAVVG